MASYPQDRVRILKDDDYGVTGAPRLNAWSPAYETDLNNPYSIIYSTGPDVLTEATFPALNPGRSADADVLVIPKGQVSLAFFFSWCDLVSIPVFHDQSGNRNLDWRRPSCLGQKIVEIVEMILRFKHLAFLFRKLRHEFNRF